MNLEKITIDILKLTALVGEFIKEERNKISSKNIESKGIHDFVTYVDKTSEKKLVHGLKNILPEAGFIAEEQTETFVAEEFNWIIDPLDGTTNYIHGAPPYAISIALKQNDEIIIGVVHEITLDEKFYTWKGAASYLNGKEINVSQKQKIKDSLLATGFPYYDYKRIDPFLQTLKFFMENSHGIRRLGSAATDLAYVACGRYDAFYEYSLSPWDVAAGALLVQNAGGKVSDFKGENNWLFGREIIASNNLVFNEFLQQVQSIMN
jgi:myo-inositol-1(or 4)-monophosphatase